MHRCKLARRRKKNGKLGAAGSARGGDGELLLPKLGGTFWWVAGGVVMVKRGSNWAEGGCGGWLLDGSILDRSGGRCLLWSVRAVVSVWVEGREVWEGGGLVSSGEDFGVSLWSVVRGIVRWRGVCVGEWRNGCLGLILGRGWAVKVRKWMLEVG